VPTNHPRRGGDIGEHLARELRRRARPPDRPPTRRVTMPPLAAAVLIVLAFLGLVFLAAIAATITAPTGGCLL
jgi:hypothetical protein